MFPFISNRFDVSHISFQLLSLPFCTPPRSAPCLSPKRWCEPRSLGVKGIFFFFFEVYYFLFKWKWFLQGLSVPHEKLQAELH